MAETQQTEQSDIVFNPAMKVCNFTAAYKDCNNCMAIYSL